MVKRTRIALAWTSVHSGSTSVIFMPCTGWYSTDEVGNVRFVVEVRALGANLGITPGYQTANVENAPDSAVTVGSEITSDGNNYGSVADTTSNTNGKQIVRFGYNVRLTTGSTFTCGRVGGFVDVWRS